jgi:hypothetical protein
LNAALKKSGQHKKPGGGLKNLSWPFTFTVLKDLLSNGKPAFLQQKQLWKTSKTFLKLMKQKGFQNSAFIC